MMLIRADLNIYTCSRFPFLLFRKFLTTSNNIAICRTCLQPDSLSQPVFQKAGFSDEIVFYNLMNKLNPFLGVVVIRHFLVNMFKLVHFRQPFLRNRDSNFLNFSNQIKMRRSLADPKRSYRYFAAFARNWWSKKIKSHLKKLGSFSQKMAPTLLYKISSRIMLSLIPYFQRIDSISFKTGMKNSIFSSIPWGSTGIPR